MKVTEIFASIEGEGKRAGMLSVFVRFAGCNLRCTYCDTTYSQCESDGHDMTVDEIVDEIEKYEIFKVTLTGGEPLTQNFEEMTRLIECLCTHGYEVNVETNGSVPINFYRTNMYIKSSLFFTVDYKSKSSGESSKMFLDNYKRVEPWDVVKFVVGNQQDLEDAWLITRMMTADCHIYVSPVFGEIEPSEIVQFMLDHKIKNWHIQLQLHKYIWDPEVRGV